MVDTYGLTTTMDYDPWIQSPIHSVFMNDHEPQIMAIIGGWLVDE